MKKVLISSFTSGETVKKMLKFYSFDYVVLFCSDKFLDKAEKFIKANKLKGEVCLIDAFNINPLMQVIGNKVSELSSERLIVNITEGTNLMASVFLASSYYYGLRTFIFIDDGLIELPITSLKETRYLTESAKKWLKEIKKSRGVISLSNLANGINAQRLTVPLRILRKAGFIEMESLKYGNKTIKLTELGELYGGFMG
jgi:hypothetical protein